RELAPGVGPRARRDPCRVAPCRARAAGRRGRRRPLSCAAPRARPGPRGLRGPFSLPGAWFAPTPALPRERGRGGDGGGGDRAGPAPCPACGGGSVTGRGMGRPGRPRPFPRLWGRAGTGAVPDARTCGARRLELAPTPTLPRARGRGV